VVLCLTARLRIAGQHPGRSLPEGGNHDEAVTPRRQLRGGCAWRVAVAIVVGFLESAIRSTGMIIGDGRLPMDEKIMRRVA
jgi:hypothetical protein